jgi:diaminopimelate decarboxylase
MMPASGKPATVINRKEIYRTHVGLGASMSALMRPDICNAFHHITVPGKVVGATQVAGVLGSLCENNDKFAIQRALPPSQKATAR